MNDEWTLERRVALHVRKRWDTLSDESKRILGCTENDKAFFQLMWERDFYREIARQHEECNK